MLPASYSCPRCRCSALCRKRRKGMDWLLSAVGLRPVICLTCGKKSFMHLDAKDLKPPMRPKRGHPEKEVVPQRVASKPRKVA